MDFAPGVSTPPSAADDPGLPALQEEARRGVTDGDVIMSMVTLVGLDARVTQFASTMSVLEDSLDMIIERGELDIAADIAEALRAGAANPEVSQEQRRRLERAIGRFSKPSDIRAIVHALKVYAQNSPENRSARRLISIMGSLAIEPLLEQLADEEDMSARKMLIDLLGEMAPAYILEMGAHVTDPRWYVVRNVVAILGTTRSPAVLPFIERTIRHADARVRREAIRALSAIPDRLAFEMLIVPLSDEDAQNVQLAARYIGVSGQTAAIPTLEQVARGDGRGSRETGPRVEAIEALGKLRAESSLHVLGAIAGKRSLLRGNKNRELKLAAESAIARIASGEGGAP
jgi:HEAT repeat protein